MASDPVLGLRTMPMALATILTAASLFAPMSQVDVTVTLNQCPTISWFLAGPLDLYVGGTAQFEVKAADKDRNPLSYVWTVQDVDGPRLLVPDFKATKPGFTCKVAGEFPVAVYVTDGHCGAPVQTATVKCSVRE